MTGVGEAGGATGSAPLAIGRPNDFQACRPPTNTMSLVYPCL